MKIVADEQIPHIRACSAFAEVVLCNGHEITAEKICDADVLIVRSVTTVDADLLQESHVRFVASATSGLNHIDLDYLRRNNINFASAKGGNAQAVAEYVLSSLCALAVRYDFKLKDKTVGIIGCGEVGSRVINLLETMDLTILKNDPPLQDLLKSDLAVSDEYCDLQELLTADIITVHVPLTKDGHYPTHNLLDAKVLDQLNDDVILLNTARGGVVNEVDLKNHLARHGNMKVVLDVWDNEPNIDVDLLGYSDIGTPHIAGYSTHGRLCGTKMIFESVGKFFQLEHQWHSPYALPATHNLALPADDMNDQDAIHSAILASYDVRNDSILLQDMLAIDGEQRGDYFDKTRQGYPARREFSETVVHLRAERTALTRQLQKLGFNVTTFL